MYFQPAVSIKYNKHIHPKIPTWTAAAAALSQSNANRVWDGASARSPEINNCVSYFLESEMNIVKFTKEQTTEYS